MGIARAKQKSSLRKNRKTVKGQVKPASSASDIKLITEKGKPSKFTWKLSPMLATLVDKPFDDEGWIYEIKWDGYRALAFMYKGKVELKSRNDKSFNEKFYPVTKAIKDWGINAIVDGEVVVISDSGISHFGNLQNWRSEADGELQFYVFDLLWHDGKDLTQLPLTERREVLRSLVPADGIIRMSENFGKTATEFFEAARQMGLEGIIAKKADSVYSIGVRTKEWLKIKANKRQEMVIGGYTKNDGSSKPFSSLLLGVFEKGELVYTGKVGTGFNNSSQNEMLKIFKPLITKKSPFSELPDINKPSRFRPDPPNASAVFMKPKLVCEVSYTEMTADGVMRHPSFEGMRTDKKASEVIRETEVPVAKLLKGSNRSGNKKLLQPTGKKDRKSISESKR